MCAEYLNWWLIFNGPVGISINEAAKVRHFRLDYLGGDFNVR